MYLWCARWLYNQLEIFSLNIAEYLNSMLIWILHFSCLRRSWNQLQIFSLNWAQYLNSILIWILHCSCLRRSWSQLQIFSSNWGQYLNSILIWILHFSCVRRSGNQLQMFFWIELNISIGVSYELSIPLDVVDRVINCKSFLLNSAEYLNRILLWIIHFSCVLWIT